MNLVVVKVYGNRKYYSSFLIFLKRKRRKPTVPYWLSAELDENLPRFSQICLTKIIDDSYKKFIGCDVLKRSAGG